MIKPFPLGQIVATPAALDACAKADHNPSEFVRRHASGDWGEMDAEDTAANNRAVTSGQRVMSAYRLKDGTKIWIITESDRSATTILLPEDY